MPSKEIAKRMYGDNGPWNCFLLLDGFVEKFLQGLPGTTAEVGKELAVVEKITAQNFGYAEDEMTVWNGLEDFFTQPLAKFHDTLLVTRWTEMAAFT